MNLIRITVFSQSLLPPNSASQSDAFLSFFFFAPIIFHVLSSSARSLPTLAWTWWLLRRRRTWRLLPVTRFITTSCASNSTKTGLTNAFTNHLCISNNNNNVVELKDKPRIRDSETFRFENCFDCALLYRLLSLSDTRSVLGARWGKIAVVVWMIL